MSGLYNFKKAVVIAMGPPDANWIKVQLINGEEAFFYPDDENSFDIKKLKTGLQVTHRELRKCKKPGQTKWLTNAHSLEFQPERTKKYISGETKYLFGESRS